MNYFKIESANNGPSAILSGIKYSQQRYGDHMVEDILPGCYGLKICHRYPQWTDLLSSLDVMLWSQCVVEAFNDSGLIGVEFYPQKLVHVPDKRLQQLPDPNYHWAHALTGVSAIPFQQDGVTPCPLKPGKGFYDMSKAAGGLCRWKFDFSTWNGGDLFYIATAHTRYRYCTERLKNVVEKQGFTNFRFTGAQNEEGDVFFA